jgi:hypothetical protein
MRIPLLLILLITSSQLLAQLRGVYVETYYITDSLDLTDTYGGTIDSSTVTFRVYAELEPGTKVLALFADTDHPVRFQSTANFYNHASDGQTFAKEFLKARYSEGLVALDTWLTLGQTTKKQGNITHYGIPKKIDTNGSFIGGSNNDGGSEMIPTGLLNNQELEYPLTQFDGMDTIDYTPENWFSFGLQDFLTGNDSTIFGSLVASNTFESDNLTLSCSGVTGVVPDSNYVLLGQFSTSGEFNFVINLRLQLGEIGNFEVLEYVGTNNLTSESQIYSPFLSFPLECGCTDPDYIEYSPSFGCSDSTSCVHQVIFGCLDTLACNYNALANYSLPNLCCYPGWCANRDIQEVCPNLMGESLQLKIFPNPVSDQLNFVSTVGIVQDYTVRIINSNGLVMYEKRITQNELIHTDQIDISSWATGIYQISMISSDQRISQLIVKI